MFLLAADILHGVALATEFADDIFCPTPADEYEPQRPTTFRRSNIQARALNHDK